MVRGYGKKREVCFTFNVLTFRILLFRGVHSNIDLELSLISGDKRPVKPSFILTTNRGKIHSDAHAQAHARYSEGTRRVGSRSSVLVYRVYNRKGSLLCTPWGVDAIVLFNCVLLQTPLFYMHEIFHIAIKCQHFPT